MESPAPIDRVESALARTPPFDALLGLVEELRAGGMPRTDLLALLDEARERHASDADETRYDAILDVMDLITGWCAPSQRLYPDPQ